MREVVILGSGRTAGGKYDGSLKSLTAPQFGGQVVKETIKRSGITPETIDQTIFGSAWQAVKFSVQNAAHQLNKVDILPFIVATNIIGFSQSARMINYVNGPGMIFYP